MRSSLRCWVPGGFVRARALAVVVLCASPGCSYLPQYVPPPPASAVEKLEKPPFKYESLNVRNSCFVESVHFYDEYLAKERGGERTWARVLQWGNQEGDFKLNSGHAVTVFVAKERLWAYDINFSVRPVDLPIDRRADITDVAPKIFERYPQFSPVFARYRDDFPQKPAEKRPEFLFYHANEDVRDATRVAHELGRFRPVSVFEFELPKDSAKETACGVAFLFGRRVCLYFPRTGTHVSPPFRGDADDIKYVTAVTKRLFKGAENVRWQPGGYLFFPPGEAKGIK